MAMKGKFKPTLTLKDGDKVVDARGWIDWDLIPADVKRVRVAATIIQDAETNDPRDGTAWAGRTYNRPNGNGEQWWQCDVPEDNGKTFQRKPTPVGGVFVSNNPRWAWAWGDLPTIV
jgi:hypothetical protein